MSDILVVENQLAVSFLTGISNSPALLEIISLFVLDFFESASQAHF